MIKIHTIRLLLLGITILIPMYTGYLTGSTVTGSLVGLLIALLYTAMRAESDSSWYIYLLIVVFILLVIFNFL